MQEINGISNGNGRYVEENNSSAKPKVKQDDINKKIGDMISGLDSLDSSQKIKGIEELIEGIINRSGAEELTEEQLEKLMEELEKTRELLQRIMDQLPKDKNGNLKKPPIGLQPPTFPRPMPDLPDNPIIREPYPLPHHPDEAEVKPVPLPYPLTPEETEILRKKLQ